jgi:hypothetical protein
MSTLVIAPQSNINNVIDWVSSANGRSLKVLNGYVTVREVLALIASGQFRILHFATHGCPTALSMSDGDIPDHLLEDAIRAGGRVELVILSACSSIAIGAQLYMAGVPRVLSWRTEVDDKVAGEWARTFYASLGMSNDIWDAQVTAGEAVRRLGHEPPIFLNGRLAKLETQVKVLEQSAQVGGVPKWLAAVLAGYGVVLLLLFGMLAQVHG